MPIAAKTAVTTVTIDSHRNANCTFCSAPKLSQMNELNRVVMKTENTPTTTTAHTCRMTELLLTSSQTTDGIAISTVAMSIRSASQRFKASSPKPVKWLGSSK